jgi:hypothetical protein
VRLGRVDPVSLAAPHFRPHPGPVRRLVDRTDPAPLRLVRGIDRWEACRPPRVCCDPWWWACAPPAIRLRYWEYLERQNIAYADVRPGLMPPGGTASAPGTVGAKPGDHGLEGGRPSYAMPHLGDIPAPDTPRFVRRVEITYRREVFQPAGNLIDIFA